jgi:hypothetical protein
MPAAYAIDLHLPAARRNTPVEVVGHNSKAAGVARNKRAERGARGRRSGHNNRFRDGRIMAATATQYSPIMQPTCLLPRPCRAFTDEK